MALVLVVGWAEGNYELWRGLYRLESVWRLGAARQSTGERWKDDLVRLGTQVVAVSEEWQFLVGFTPPLARPLPRARLHHQNCRAS
jgi:hypothetical protein